MKSLESALVCPVCQVGRLIEPPTIEGEWQFVPVKCSDCTFTGRRVNLIVVPDGQHGESWMELGLSVS